MLGIQGGSVTLTFLLSISRGVGGLGPADFVVIGGAATAAVIMVRRLASLVIAGPRYETVTLLRSPAL
jgi:hypothetical protein